jgi:hypothetical protein
MNCSACGKFNEDGLSFCVFCGTKMQSGAASNNAPAAAQPTPAQPAAPPQNAPMSAVQTVVSEPAKPVSLRRKLAYALAAVLLAVLGGVAWWWFHRPIPAYVVEDPGIYPLPVVGADGKTAKWGFIDAAGEGTEWNESVFFSEGLCGVKKAGKWGYINTNGILVIPNQFDYARPFIEGLANVQLGNQIGFINKTGQYEINPQFDQAGDFHEGLAAVHTDSGWGFINKAGTYAINPRFQSVDVRGFSDGLVGVCLAGKCGYIDHNGTFAIRPQFDGAGTFSEGMASVGINGKWGYINIAGKVVINPQFDWATMFSNGLAAVGVSGRAATINKQGRYVVNPGQYQFKDIEADLMPVKSSDGEGLMTRDGKWVIKPSNILEPVMMIGKVLYFAVDVGVVRQFVTISMSGKVLAGPYKGEMLDSMAQDVENTISAAKSFQALISAEASYSGLYPAKGFTTSLDKLGPATGTPDQNHAGLIDADLATGFKDGYQFTVTIPAGNSAAGTNFNYFLVAKPIAGHVGLSYCTDSTGPPHIAMEGEECTLASPKLAPR